MEGVTTDVEARVSDLDHRSSWAAHNWGWVLAFGVAAIAFGAALIGSAFTTLGVLAWLAGLFLVLAGVAEIFVPLTSGARRRHLAGAVIAIAGGVVLLVWPGETLTVLAFVTGIAFTAWGLVAILTALLGPVEGRGWEIVAGVGAVVLGILIMAWPTQSLAVVGVLAGLVAAVWGAVTVAHAMGLRNTGRRWDEARRAERERSDRQWREFERAEEARERGGIGTPAEAETSGEADGDEGRQAA